MIPLAGKFFGRVAHPTGTQGQKDKHIPPAYPPGQCRTSGRTHRSRCTLPANARGPWQPVTMPEHCKLCRD